MPPVASLRLGSGGLLLFSCSATLLLDDLAGRSGSSAGGRLAMGLGVCVPVGVALPPASALMFKAVASGFSAPLSSVKQVASGLTMPEVELVLQGGRRRISKRFPISLSLSSLLTVALE